MSHFVTTTFKFWFLHCGSRRAVEQPFQRHDFLVCGLFVFFELCPEVDVFAFHVVQFLLYH